MISNPVELTVKLTHLSGHACKSLVQVRRAEAESSMIDQSDSEKTHVGEVTCSECS